MASNPLIECAVCQEEFNDANKCPRTLPCSHYFCSECISNFIKIDRKHCPVCRQSFQAASAADIMVNRAIQVYLEANKQPNSNNKNDSVLDLLKNEAQGKLSKLTTSIVNDEAESEKQIKLIDKCLDIIQSREREIEEIISGLSSFRDRNLEKQSILEDERNKIVDRIGKQRKEIEMMSHLKRNLDAAKTYEKAGSVVDEVNSYKNIIQDFEHQKTKSQSEKTIQLIEKDLERTDKNIQRIINNIQSMKCEPKELQTPESKCHDKKNLPSNFVLVEINELKEKSSRIKTAIRGRRLFAVDSLENKYRFAMISVDGSKVLMHQLIDELPPPSSLIVKHDELLNAVDASTHFAVAFLKLRASNIALGTLYIGISHNELGKQFILHCTGQSNQSFANKMLKGVVNKGYPGEGVRIGGFPKSSKKSGAAKGKGRNKGCNRQAKAGVITAVDWSSENQAEISQYIICLKDFPDRICDSAFGEVLLGFDILVKAIDNVQDVSAISISECGLVVSS